MNTSFKDIKFGRHWEIPEDEDWTSHNEIVVYTRLDHEHRTQWWEQIKPEDTITKVFEWLDGRIIASKPGGIITVMLIGHGSPDGVNLGGQILNPAALTSRCSRFPADVQISIIIKACYSGVFAKAFKVSNQRKIYVHTSAKSDQRSFSGRRSAISGRVRNFRVSICSHFRTNAGPR
jgi:peptidase C13-like protein